MQRAEAAAPGQTLAGWGGQEDETEAHTIAAIMMEAFPNEMK